MSLQGKSRVKINFSKKPALLLTLLIAVASAAAVAAAAGGENFADLGSVVGFGYAGGGRRLAEHTVYTMTELYNRINKYSSDKMENGDTTTLSVGSYKCSDGTCGSAMLIAEDLYGAIQCLNDDASCVLDGESSKRLMEVRGTGAGKLTIRAIRFYKGKSGNGGGVGVNSGAKIDITLCVFDSCEATNTGAHYQGGGGIYVDSPSTAVNIYATAFTGNSASSGNGDDIYRNGGGTVTIHDTCPSPYSANTPTQGKKGQERTPCRTIIYRLLQRS